MSRRPRIGLTLELLDPIIAKVDERMREVIESAGGLAVVIPHSNDPDSWRAAYEIVDAIVMMGGPDVSAEAYGATPHPLTKPGHAGVDTTELGLARACAARRQAGARHLPRQPGAQRGRRAARSCRTSPRRALRSCTWASGCASWTSRRATSTRSRCSPARGSPSWLGAGSHVVNSYHHQAVDRLGDGLRTSAVAPDGTIEAIESVNGTFALGLQWHNEFHMRGDERYARPLQALVSAARA